MCATCDQAAEAVAASTNGVLDASDVRAIVSAFHDVSDALKAGVTPEDVTPTEAPSAPGAGDGEPNPEDGWLSMGMVPEELMDALVVAMGGPVVVVGARSIGAGLAVSIFTAGCSKEQAEWMLKESHGAFADPMPNGGIREDGGFVTPLIERTRKPRNEGPA